MIFKEFDHELNTPTKRIDNCKVCYSSDDCSQCFSGYYLSDTNKCIRYGSYCDNCRNGVSCDKCIFAGCYFDASADACVSCSPGCSLCVSYLNCTSCNQYYFMSASSICEQCSPHCSICISLDNCTECDERTYLISGYCKLCSSNCLTCVSVFGCIQCYN